MSTSDHTPPSAAVPLGQHPLDGLARLLLHCAERRKHEQREAPQPQSALEEVRDALAELTE